MGKEYVTLPDKFSPVGAYSQVVRVGNLYFISGQISMDLDTKNIMKSDIRAQTHQVMKNIKEMLTHIHLSLSHIVKVTIFTTNLEKFSDINEVYAAYFNGNFPARSCIQVSRLPLDVDIEIEVVAAAD